MSRQKLPKLIWVGAALLITILTLLSAAHASLPKGEFTASRGASSRRKLARMQRHLSRINKPAVKTIQSADGDFIDCVKTALQPAFDHPALANHSLEAPPELFPLNLEASKLASGGGSLDGPQLWHQSGQGCPEGTVAIRRTLVKDVLRAGSLAGYKRKKNGLASVPQPSRPQTMSDNGHEVIAVVSRGVRAQLLKKGVKCLMIFGVENGQHAISYMQGDLYYGAQATMNVWSPSVQVASEFSLSQMWLLAGSFNGDLNSIEAGWQVSPQLYGDNNPRLFTYWTRDAYQATGCYNLLCSGFIQTSNAIAIGAAINPVSSSAGSQYDIRILIWKDPVKGNWWMQFGERFLVGYWPASIFTHLASSATMLEWGGEVVNTQPDGHHSTTSMGSGQFAEKGFAQASYLRDIKYVDANNVLKTPVGMQTLAEHPNCYNIQSSVNGEWGAYFYYGGPGQNSNCP